MIHAVEGQHLRAASHQPKVGLSDKLGDGLHFCCSTEADCLGGRQRLMRRNSYSLRIPRNLETRRMFFCKGGGSFLGRDRRADGVRGAVGLDLKIKL